MRRYLHDQIMTDLRKKMVLLGGPRQCGKTTLAQQILDAFPYEQERGGRYFNWDLDEDRRALLAKRWHEEDELLVFDELHKYHRWKNWLKGIYDTSDRHRFLVTGSARLDTYRRGGDSLLGRYHYWRLHPLTIDERPPGMDRKDAFARLMSVGGFPEPFLDNDEREARRWRRERFDRVLRDDIRDLEPLRNVQALILLVDALRARVGKLIVVSNLARDLEVSPKTVKHWLTVLERMYVIFAVYPLVKKIPRAVRKPPKIFFYDNCDVLEERSEGLGPRFENLIATHLLKRIQFLQDRDGYSYELRYIRDKEGREVDFAVVKEGEVVEIIEAKYGDRDVARSLRYYAERLRPKRAVQFVANLTKRYSEGSLSVTSPLLEDI